MRQFGKSRWQPTRLHRLVFIAGILLLTTLACNLPTSITIDNPFADADYIETSVAKTLVAWEINVSPAETEAVLDDTEIPGENTTLTLTPTGHESPGDAKVLMSQNTNCRTGQGTDFERIMILLKGEEADVVGVDTSGSYWYIRQPEQPNSFCWLWGKYATPSGSYESVPVFTQVPTPTPGFEFTINYHSSIGLCGGFVVLKYQIINTGSETLESWRTKSTDHTGGSVPITSQQDKFFGSGCTLVGDKQYLAPGESYYVNALFTTDPAAHDLTVTVLGCTQDGLGGSCVSRKISHTP
jgi:hypothetical protein